MTIFENYVYWSERYTSKVMRTNKFHGSNFTTVMSSVFQPMGIIMDHPTKQPTGIFTIENSVGWWCVIHLYCNH